MDALFGHERLTVYRRAREFYREAIAMVRAARRPPRFLVEQLERASASIALNIAEGAGEFSRKEKARFYRIALRSATECAAVLDLLTAHDQTAAARAHRGRSLLREIIAMLTRMATNSTHPTRPPNQPSQPPNPPNPPAHPAVPAHPARSTSPTGQPAHLPDHLP